MVKRAVVVSPEYWSADFGRFHPVRPMRVKLAYQLMQQMGLITEEEVLPPKEALLEELLLFHSKDYLDALSKEKPDLSFGLGTPDNPVFEGIWRFSLLSAGGTLVAAEVVSRGGVAFNLGGGMHHAAPSAASGFCYLNDVAVAIEKLKREGLRVFYLDTDAHHCDAVQRAFYRDPNVFVFSVHQEDAFPGTGRLEDLGEGEGLGFNVNVPLPRYSEDEDMLWVLEELFLPLFERFSPDVLFWQVGADAHKDDPLTNLFMTTGIYSKMGEIVGELGVPTLMTAGGGYDMVNVARVFAIVWGRVTGREIPDTLPESFLRISIMEGYDGPSIWDIPGWTGDRQHVKGSLKERVSYLKAKLGF